MARLPLIQTTDKNLSLLQTQWKAILDPLLAIQNTTPGGDGFPVGGFLSYPNIKPPTKFLLCNAALLPVASYGPLFNVMGTAFNLSTDPSGYFRLPGPNGRALLYVGQSTAAGATNHTIGQTGGEETHTLVASELALHTHPISDPGHHHVESATATSGPSGGGIAGIAGTATQGAIPALTTQPATTGITGTNNQTTGGGAHNTLPPYLCIGYLMVKYLP